ncbi:hypothetical protein BH09BAC3_BH09BAC3_10210 [soil metagenome]
MMQRRAAIFLGIGTLALAFPFTRWLTRKPRSARLMEICAVPLLLTLIAGEEGIQKVGKSAIFIEMDKEEFVSMILRDLPGKNLLEEMNDRELQWEISKKIQNEFRRGEIEIVGGWILSRTEVLQCQLYNLLRLESKTSLGYAH